MGRCFGSQPRAKVSMMIMRPPQHGHGRGSTRGSSIAAVGASGCSGRDGTASSLRACAMLSMSELFELYVGALFTPGLVCAREAPRRDQACRRARDRQGRCAPLARWPEDGPSLTAAVRDGPGCVQVGAEGWCRSNKRMERESVSTWWTSHFRFRSAV